MALTSKERPLVSIVIPVYNCERYVGDTLDSVINQTWRELEIIIVNDGSTDRSLEICRRFSDPRIRYVEHENRGLAAARNSGIEHARGEYIGFIDADDIWLPEKVATHMQQFSSDPDLGLSYSYSKMIDEAGEDLLVFQKEGKSPTTFFDCYTRNVIGNGSNAMLRIEVFSGRASDNKSFPPMHAFNKDLRRAEDFELWSRIACLTKWKIDCFPKALVLYRINGAGLSANTKYQRYYHLFVLALIGQYTPYLAEKYRQSGVAHLYWHQCRTFIRQRDINAGLKAMRVALHYNWRTLSCNHFMMVAALISATILPSWIYFRLDRLASRIWGLYQRVNIYCENTENFQPATPCSGKENLSEFIAKPDRYLSKRASANLFFLSHKHEMMFVGIAQNELSTLKYTLYREESDERTDTSLDNVQKYWGQKPRAGRTIRVKDKKALKAYASYTRFAVYRDPVSRFLSVYQNKVLYSEDLNTFYIKNRLEGMALDHFINVVATILKIKNYEHIDENLRPQMGYYCSEDVDYIVPIEHLNDFLKSKFEITTGGFKNEHKMVRIGPTSEQIERIRDLYASDYAIKPNWPNG